MVHHGFDDQYIINHRGNTQQVVIALRVLLVEPEVAWPSLLLDAVVDNVLDELWADTTLKSALLSMCGEHNL